MQQVFLDGMTLLEEVLLLTKKARLVRTAIIPKMDPIILSLMDKLADPNVRIRDGSKKGLDVMISSPSVGAHAISIHALKSLNSKQISNWKIIVARIKLIHDIVNAIGIGGLGLNAEAIMMFLKNLTAFTHGNGEVRDAAKNLVVFIQKTTGTPPLQSYLIELRPKQLEEYMFAFDNSGSSIASSNVTSTASLKKDPNNNGKMDSKPVAVNYNPTGVAGIAASTKSNPSQSQTPAPSKQPAATTPSSPHHHNHSAHGSVPQPSHPHTPNDAKSDNAAFQTCMFCSEHNKTWNEDALDLHYWKSCPLLSPCPACAQVVEIAGLPEHLLEECEKKVDYVSCDVTGKQSINR